MEGKIARTTVRYEFRETSETTRNGELTMTSPLYISGFQRYWNPSGPVKTLHGKSWISLRGVQTRNQMLTEYMDSRRVVPGQA